MGGLVDEQLKSGQTYRKATRVCNIDSDLPLLIGVLIYIRILGNLYSTAAFDCAFILFKTTVQCLGRHQNRTTTGG